METQPSGSQVFEDDGFQQHAGPTIEDTVGVAVDETETAKTETRDAALYAKEGDKQEQAPPSNDVEEKERTSKQPDTSFAVEENTEQEKVENEVAAGDSNETSTTKSAGQKRLIIPNNSHIPIKLSMTNIFAKSAPTAESEANAKDGSHLQSKPSLDVKASIWMTQQELKRTKQKQATANLAEKDDLESGKRIAELPDPPASWGPTTYLHPHEQAPPKKRGRKPKKAPTSEDKKIEEQVAPSRRVRQKSKPENPASSSSPSQRMRKYLQDQKDKKASKEIGEHTAEASVSESTKKKGEKQISGESVDVERPKKRVKKSQTENMTKKRKSDQQEIAAESETKRVRSTEAKQRVSRKSAAYHRAYKQWEGSEEEKKAAARKVHWMHSARVEYVQRQCQRECVIKI